MNDQKIDGGGERQIFLAEHSGYCFGVRQSVEKAEELLRSGAGSVYVCGPLIHNEAVMEELEEKGLIFIEDPEEVAEGGTLIIRSHGEGADFYARAGGRGLNIVDSTCPYVKRIHNLVQEAYARGMRIVIVGDGDHPEVRGINGWCENTALIIDDVNEVNSILSCIDEEDIYVVAQTTAIKKSFDDICNELSKKVKNVIIKNTICDATQKRQASCEETAGKVEIMIILGGRNSSNTRKLFEAAKKNCKKSFFVEKIDDLPLKEIQKCNTIGVAAGASTPERMIKEVIANMTVNTENTEKNSMDDFMEEIEKSLRLPRAGEIVTGTVIQVSNRDVIINLGCKKDGVIPKDEITLEPEKTLLDMFKEGDEVQAKVLKTDDGDGNILLSKKKVVINEHWEDINRAMEEKSVIEAKVVKEVNGGVIAVFKEIYGFIPLSQLSDRYVDKADEFIGKVLPVKVTRVDQKRNKVVFSHKLVLAEERQKRLQKIWASISIGDVIEGTVMRFTEYGAFVDIGGIDGLLHISEISWGKLKHPQEVLKIGQKIPVKVLSIVKEKEKISLGYKQNQPEPWSIIDEKYSIGQIVSGKAVQIKDYGVFVELEPGLDGLVHISEIAYKRVNNISDELTVGQDVTAKILEIDKDRKRISLSIKETAERPEEDEEVEASAVAEPADVVESDVAESADVAEVVAVAGSEEDRAEAAESVSETETGVETVTGETEEAAKDDAAEEVAVSETAEEAVAAEEVVVSETAAEETVASEIVVEEVAVETVAEETVAEAAAEEVASEPVAEETPEIVAEETAATVTTAEGAVAFVEEAVAEVEEMVAVIEEAVSVIEEAVAEVEEVLAEVEGSSAPAAEAVAEETAAEEVTVADDGAEALQDDTEEKDAV